MRGENTREAEKNVEKKYERVRKSTKKGESTKEGKEGEEKEERGRR